ncbi:MAG: omptin family outer membrane protease [Treponema sp.]|jgi:outer membrane protease|nr:omptin family outer membrane protease [Treponema sp.]
MRKKITAPVLFMVFAVNAHGLDNLHFSILGNEYAPGITAYFDLSYLNMQEIVYKDSSSGDVMSKIDWDIRFHAAAGTGFLLEPVNPFRKISLSLGGIIMWNLPVNNRTITDTDWEEDGSKFSYGETVASTISGTEAEGRIALVFPVRGKFIIEPAAELWYGRHAVLAHDGWTKQVPPGEPWNDDAEIFPLYGVSMEYIQEWIAFAPGLGFRMKIANSTLSVKIAVSPFIWGNHIDNHYFRKLDNDDPDQRYINYHDKTKGGMYYKVQGGWFWDITRRVQTGLSFSCRAIGKSRGDTAVSTTGLAGYSFLEKGIAGAAISNFGFGLSVRTTL